MQLLSTVASSNVTQHETSGATLCPTLSVSKYASSWHQARHKISQCNTWPRYRAVSAQTACARSIRRQDGEHAGGWVGSTHLMPIQLAADAGGLVQALAQDDLEIVGDKLSNGVCDLWSSNELGEHFVLQVGSADLVHLQSRSRRAADIRQEVVVSGVPLGQGGEAAVVGGPMGVDLFRAEHRA